MIDVIKYSTVVLSLPAPIGPKPYRNRASLFEYALKAKNFRSKKFHLYRFDYDFITSCFFSLMLAVVNIMHQNWAPDSCTYFKISRDVGAGLDTGHGGEEYGENTEEVLVYILAVPIVWPEVRGKCGC